MSCSYCGDLEDLYECYECDRWVCKDCIIVIVHFLDKVYCTGCIDEFVSKKRKREE